MRRRLDKSSVKAPGSTGEVRSILPGSRTAGVRGTPGVAVKCVDIWGKAEAKAPHWAVSDAEARKLGEQTGLDTLVVPAVNDGHKVEGTATFSLPKGICSVPRLGSKVARLKLKGIDGGSHKRWSMLFNSKQREEPYPGLTCTD